MMGREIERKFLVNLQKWIPEGDKKLIRQGYLSVDPNRTVRVRICESKAILTIKGILKGITRSEFNYSIPVADAEELLKIVINDPVEKFRYKIMYMNKLWEVDEFLGANKGLFLAEIELESEKDKIDFPPWVGQEVSTDKKYFNSYLSKYPYSNWK